MEQTRRTLTFLPSSCSDLVIHKHANEHTHTAVKKGRQRFIGVGVIYLNRLSFYVSLHLATPPTVFSRKDVRETSAEIPY